MSEAGGEGDAQGQSGAGGVGQAFEHRRHEQAGQDGHDADAELGEVTRHGQGQPHHPGLAGGIGGLAGLPVLRRHRRGVDDDAAGAICVQHRQSGHGGGGFGDHLEGADKVDHDGALESGHVMGDQLAGIALLRHRPPPGGNARAIDQNALHAMRRPRFGQSRIDGRLGGDIGLTKNAVDFSRHPLPPLRLHVENGDFDAAGGEAARRGLAEAGGGTGDDGGEGGGEVHGWGLRGNN